MPRIKVGLLVNEFFDDKLPNGAGFGGYGMVARHYIAEHLPDGEIEVETILGFHNRSEFHHLTLDGCKKLVLLPACPTSRMRYVGRVARRLQRLKWRKTLEKYLNTFDVFLSIETMPYGAELLRVVPDKKLILYVQDPRPRQDWVELDSVIHTDDGSPRPDPCVCAFYNEMIRAGRLVAISQGADLVKKARDLYELPADFPVKIIRNPVVIDDAFDLGEQAKENGALFLGRLDPVKRPWLALEVARQLPQVQFYFLGKAHHPVSPYIMYPYRNLPNVHLPGHQSGDVKTDLLKKCKCLINTSIHEAIPVSFLEALAYGTLLVSCQNPDAMAERFGVFTGAVLGDGRDQAGAFVAGIEKLIGDEPRRQKLAVEAQEYAKENHGLAKWVEDMRNVIRRAANG